MTEHEIDEFLDMCSRVKEKVEHYNFIINKKKQTDLVRQQVQAAKNWVADNQSFLYKARATRTDLFKQAKKEGLDSAGERLLNSNIPYFDPKDKAIPEDIKFHTITPKDPVVPSDVPTSSTYSPETGTVVHTPAGHPPVAETKTVHIPIDAKDFIFAK